MAVLGNLRLKIEAIGRRCEINVDDVRLSRVFSVVLRRGENGVNVAELVVGAPSDEHWVLSGTFQPRYVGPWPDGIAVPDLTGQPGHEPVELEVVMPTNSILTRVRINGKDFPAIPTIRMEARELTQVELVWGERTDTGFERYVMAGSMLPRRTSIPHVVVEQS